MAVAEAAAIFSSPASAEDEKSSYLVWCCN